MTLLKHYKNHAKLVDPKSKELASEGVFEVGSDLFELRLQSLAICDSKSLRFGSLSTQKTTHPNKTSLRKQFSGLLVQTVLPLSLKLNKRHAERVWANCSRKLFSVRFIGVGGFWGVGLFSLD